MLATTCRTSSGKSHVVAKGVFLGLRLFSAKNTSVFARPFRVGSYSGSPLPRSQERTLTYRLGISKETSRHLMMAQPFSSNLPLVLSHIMLPADANPGGNVHGGTLLKLIAESGYVQCMKHLSPVNREAKEDDQSMAVIARVEHTDFLQPVFIGELAEVYAQVSYVSPRSMEVNAEVWAENLLTGTKRLTNRASVWYVSVNSEDRGSNGVCVLSTAQIPALQLSEKEQSLGQERYLTQRKQRMSKSAHLDPAFTVPVATEGSSVVPHSPLHSQTELTHLVLPMDCHFGGILRGGVTMKMMDNCAGVVAARHCKTNVVTASLDAIDFLSPIGKGELVTVRGRLVYTSSKSMEILITVEAENIRPNSHRITNRAFFTFVSLSRETGKSQPVPPLLPQTELDRTLYEEGKARYLVNKEQRAKKLQSS